MEFQFTYMEVVPTDFTVFFQYDEALRRGKGIRVVYDLKGGFELSLIQVDKSSKAVLDVLGMTVGKPLEEGAFYGFAMQISDTRVWGWIAGAEYSFACTPGRGLLALERGNYIGELVIRQVRFESEDKLACMPVIKQTCVQVPCINGGDIPYTITWSIDRIEGAYYLKAMLDGGTRTRPVNREDRPGQYVAQKDWMTSPYIGFRTPAGNSAIYCLARGERCFVDPNIYWDCQKGFFSDTQLPLMGTYRVPRQLAEGEFEIVFGYENLVCTGYGAQAGGCEFRYTPEGKLFEYGPPPDGRDMYEVTSQENKLALSFVPEDCYRREDVLEHIKNNHYFDVSEDMEFVLEMKTMADPDYISVRAAVLNVYETQILSQYQPRTQQEEWKYGYHCIRAGVSVPRMEVGVRKIEFSVYYGEKLYHRVVKTFEVYDKDSDQNPALASGLPFAFSMPNEQKWLMSNSFDLWSPVKSCDLEHYITCITDTPIEAECRKPWRLIHHFKREWFAWLSSRTCKNWQMEEHPEVVRHADYLFCSWNEKVMDLSQSGLYPVRQDHFSYSNFMMRKETRVGILEDFLAENPQLAQRVEYKPGMEEFTFAHFVNLMQTCSAEWIAYQNQRGLELLREQNEKIRRINPGFRRSIYGPVNVYVTPAFTGHSLKAYGFSDGKDMAREIFTGFAIYEDYPYACSYQTYRGAFGLMNILLEAPKLVIYPEQYGGSRGGCIDGAVKFAHGPMGEYDVLPYQNSTQAFEYVFNTAHRLEDGYHYWSTYGFHRSDYSQAFMEKLVLDWKYVVENRPESPLRSMAFLAEYSDREDVLELFDAGEEGCGCYLNNRSENGHGLVFECSREAGVPCGFGLKYDGLGTLTAKECDVLVLPNLAFAKREDIQKIRRLYEEGVNLIAVSEVDGLEDLFGVCRAAKSLEIDCLHYGGEKEYVRGKPCRISYEPDGAKVILRAGTGEPLAMCTARTMLINTDVTNLGCEDSVSTNWAKTVHIVGGMIRRMLGEEIKRLSSPLALGQNVGITLFRTQSGRRKLLAIDYTPFDNVEQKAKQAVISLHMEDVTDVKADRAMFVGRKDGVVREVRFEILPHESVFIDLSL